MNDLLASKAILAPVAVLVAWTLVMLVWMMAVRIPALKRAGMSLKGARGGKPGALDGVLDDQAQWKAHNYIHLVEQPTLFYAIAITLALLGDGGDTSLRLAWAYVALRIVHSLVQATVNIIALRLGLFLISTLCLMGLTVRALLILFGTPS